MITCYKPFSNFPCEYSLLRITIDIFEPNFCWRVCDCLSFSKMSKLRSAGILLQERLATRREAALADMAPLLPLIVTNDTQGLVLIHKASSWYTRPCLDTHGLVMIHKALSWDTGPRHDTQGLVLTSFEQDDKEKNGEQENLSTDFLRRFTTIKPFNLFG